MKKRDETTQFFEDEVWPLFDHVNKFVFTLTLDGAYASDITQEVMIKAWEKGLEMKKYTSLSSALCSMAKHLFIDEHRRQKRTFGVFVDLDSIPDIPVPSNITTHLEYKEAMKNLCGLLDSLNPHHLQVVLLYDYYNMPMTEIAEFLDINYNTAVSYHKRALANLREQVGAERYLYEFVYGNG